MARDTRSRKIGPGLVALGSAAIVAVYATGYVRSEPTEAAVLAAATEAARQSLAQNPLVIPTQTAVPTQTSSPTATTTPTRTPTGVAGAIPTATSSTSAGIQAATPTKTATSAPTPAPTAVKTATPAPPVVSSGTYRDGTYTGSGTSRHGGIDVTVVVSGGRIVSAEISRCSTRYPCSYIEELPGDVVANQKVTARYISGATDSSRAYAQAVSAALAKAA